MSRVSDDYEPRDDGRDVSGLYEANAERALYGKRGQRALRDLRDALLALPEKRLIERALCTRGGDRLPTEQPIEPDGWDPNWARNDLIALVEEQGQGVCAVGAYVWWQKVKAGMDPEEAFAALPTLDDMDAGIWDTADAGKAAGLTWTLAWQLAYQNDEAFEGLTPEERYERFMVWLDKAIA